MQKTTIQFNTTDQPEFYKELKKRVNLYFEESKLSKQGNLNMVIKSIFMLTLYFLPFALMLSGVVVSSLAVLLMWGLMGLGLAGIGLSIMHDANHGAYSSSIHVNKFMGFTLNYLGGYHVNWKIQHNVLHHSFTNIDGLDEDIEKKGIIRFSPTQERRNFFKFQVLYAPLLYAILTLYWVTYKDFDQFFNYEKRGLIKAQNISYKKALFRIIVFKVVYYSIIIAAPILFTDIPWYITIIGFIILHAIGGFILAIVFQSAHVLSDTSFYTPDENNSVENNWAIHQMKTTSNFAMKNLPLTWLIGGLNYQVEHHLFPTICHVHYPEISKIVRKTAAEFNVPYLSHKTFIGAIIDHFVFLNKLGAGKV